ncbi:MAG: ADP-ribosylglycohydrolase family protein [Chloroflexi bacterium]|nr:ADP-ribosylglycohydrolase family protein [Chloroflexota bacterium]
MARQEALTGCLVGGAVGDALGLPLEGIPPQRARKFRRSPLRHALVGRWGMVSDDTEHAAMTAAALAVTAGEPFLFTRRLARSLRGWLASLPAGCGLATGRAILKLWLGFPPQRSGVWSAGNGPAMRAAVIGVAWGDQPQQTLDLVRASSVLTHRDPKATVGAHAVALAAWQAAQGVCDPVALGETLRADHGGVAEPLLELIERAVASADARQSTPEFCHALCGKGGVTGFIDHTVAVAMHAWRAFPEDYRQAVEGAVACGGDTDTLAAVVGGIVGARVGVAGIPMGWCQGVRDWPRSLGYLTRLAAVLASSRSLGQPVVPPRAVWLFCFVRNLVFLAIVLVHGFRRLLPPY